MSSTVVKRALCALTIYLFCVTSGTAASFGSEQVTVVSSLYKDFAWQVFSTTNDMFGKPLAHQDEKVLQRFFDQELTSLVVGDYRCTVKTREICNLDFDPIFASQDPAASDLTIRPGTGNVVVVEFTYPSNREKIRLEYQMVKSGKHWRIGDIRYPGMADSSLKKLLKREITQAGP